VDEEERNVEMQHLVAEVFEVAGALRREAKRSPSSLDRPKRGGK
jgi:hypothetical protein